MSDLSSSYSVDFTGKERAYLTGDLFLLILGKGTEVIILGSDEKGYRSLPKQNRLEHEPDRSGQVLANTA